MVDELINILLKNIYGMLFMVVKINNILKFYSRDWLNKLEYICGMKY